MKRFYMTILGVGLAYFSMGQFSTTILDFNNVSASASDGGILFQDESNNAAAYELPKGSGMHSIYSTAFWFAGMDGSGTLRMSATGYFSNEDLFPGPISSSDMYQDSAYLANYSTSIWSVTQAEINNHLAMWWQPGYVMPTSISTWPGNGIISAGVSSELAPFVDNNNNNIYEPNLGEYPYIRGDKATYIISNDMANVHSHSLGEQLGIEVHTMLYQYASSDYLNNTTFVNLHVYNRGPHSYADFKCTYNADLDLGNYADDFIGCDSVRNMIFAYNGDNDDENAVSLGYGVDPPAIGVITLNDALDGSGYFTNTVPYPYNDPTDITAYWNYMNNSWADGSEWVVGGTGAAGTPGATTTPTNYLLSGDPNNVTEWSEVSSGNTPGDRRVFMNMASVSLPSQADHCYEFAIVYSREAGNNNVQNVTSLKANADLAQAFYDSHTEFSCDPVILGLEYENHLDFNIYPNPTGGEFTVQVHEKIKDYSITITDMSGRIIQEYKQLEQPMIKVSNITNPGVYLIQVNSNNTQISKRVVVK